MGEEGGGWRGHREIPERMEVGDKEGPYLSLCTLFVPTSSTFGGRATRSSYKFTPRAVASPDAPQKPLVHKRARFEGGTVGAGESA